MARKRYIGIDPGVTGAMACVEIDDEDYSFADISVLDIPTKEANLTTAKRRRVDTDRLRWELHAWEPDAVRVMIEDVQAIGKTSDGRRRDGVVGAFSFGRAAGILEGVVTAMDFPLSFVKPQVWKVRVGLPRGSDKDASLELARQLYPAAASALRLKKHHNRADAVLIAHYARIEKGA